jgi:hypothetical protein
MSHLSRLPTAQNNTLKLTLHGSSGVMLDRETSFPHRKMFYDIYNLRPSHVSNRAHSGLPLRVDRISEHVRGYYHERLASFLGIIQDTSSQEERLDHAEVLLVLEPSAQRLDNDWQGITDIPLEEEEIADTREQVAAVGGRLDENHVIRKADKTLSCNVCETRDCEEFNTFFGYWDSSDDEED